MEWVGEPPEGDLVGRQREEMGDWAEALRVEWGGFETVD